MGVLGFMSEDSLTVDEIVPTSGHLYPRHLASVHFQIELWLEIPQPRPFLW